LMIDTPAIDDWYTCPWWLVHLPLMIDTPALDWYTYPWWLTHLPLIIDTPAIDDS